MVQPMVPQAKDNGFKLRLAPLSHSKFKKAIKFKIYRQLLSKGKHARTLENNAIVCEVPNPHRARVGTTVLALFSVSFSI